MKQKYLIIDVLLCHDCNNCFMGCKDEFVDNAWDNTDPQPRHGHRWMNILRRERGVYSRNDVSYLPMPCQHCENAPCMAVGGDAVIRREDGIVMIDKEKAKGNKALEQSCPYGAIYYNDTFDVPQKCTMCAHLLDDAEWLPAMPRCVHNCPTGAMTFANLDEAELAAMVEQEGLEAYRAELGTKPHVLYKNLYKFAKNFVSAGVLLEGDCFEGAIATIVGEGHTETQETNFFGEFKFDGLSDGSYIITITGAEKSYQTPCTIEGNSLNLGFINL